MSHVDPDDGGAPDVPVADLSRRVQGQAHPDAPFEWTGHQGQIVNWGRWSIGIPVIVVGLVTLVTTPYPFYAIGGLVALLAAFYCLYVYYDAKCRSYAVSRVRLETRHGVFNTVTNNLQLYRVKDVVVREPLIYRLMSVGDVRVLSTDRSTPVLVIQAISNPHEVADLVRRNTEAERIAKGVREVD